MDCLEKLVDCIAKFNKGEIDADTSCQIEKQILNDEIQDTEFLNFAVENISELFGYLATGRVNISELLCRQNLQRDFEINRLSELCPSFLCW